MHIIYIVSLGVSLGFFRALDAERRASGAADSRSDAGAEAIGGRLQANYR